MSRPRHTAQESDAAPEQAVPPAPAPESAGTVLERTTLNAQRRKKWRLCARRTADIPDRDLCRSSAFDDGLRACRHTKWMAPASECQPALPMQSGIRAARGRADAPIHD